ncbi:MAG: energy-coupling factor transporter transmembrane protein EcfT [Lachnospiraceae bacterium]|nr:energy-coupling factor transporter transmembrane protein EcfT [Lachnospiraceae bacterium]
MEMGLKPSTAKGVFRLDPRTKLALLITVGIIMMSGKYTGVEYTLRLICICVPFILLLSVRLYKSAVIAAVLLLATVLCEGFIIPKTSGLVNLLIMIVCGVISRFGPGYLCGWYVVRSTSVSEFVTAMERMHFPNVITIPMSVMFRYFPTLKEEYASIHDAMKMREIGQSIKNPFTYIEYILVPIMMSTVQIANDLSAASLTKGLGTGRKRTHICNIGLTPVDVGLIVIMTGMLALFFIF